MDCPGGEWRESPEGVVECPGGPALCGRGSRQVSPAAPAVEASERCGWRLQALSRDTSTDAPLPLLGGGEVPCCRGLERARGKMVEAIGLNGCR